MAASTNAALDNMLERMRAAVDAITLPELPSYGPSGEDAVSRMLEIFRERITSFA